VRRTLVLKREALASLSGDDLAQVAGGQWSGYADSCVRCLVFQHFPTKFDCPTWICP
jgi:hypothetical protein